MGILALLLLPFKLIYVGFFSIFTLSTISGTFGFGCGLFVGLVVGYWAFICTLPMTVERQTIPENLGGENGLIDPKTLKRLVQEMPIWVKNPDYDRVDWINTLLREMWPFIDKAVEAQVKTIVPPLIAQYKPKPLESIEIDTLTLGSLPPTLAGIKVYDTADDEMIIEPVLKWAGNPNIIVAAKAVGVKATVQLVDLTVFATARITLKPLVPVFPCFSRITVGLMSKPTVDFGLKVIGGDLMAIPGLYNFVQELIGNIVADKMLWPKVFEVFNADDGSGLKKPVGWLYVKKLVAKNLKNLERFGKSDPYVRLSLGGKLGNKITTVKYDNLNPSWDDEEFQLLVKDPENEVLELQVYDKESSVDKLMSVQRFPLKDLVPDEPKSVTLELVKDFKSTPGQQASLGKSATMSKQSLGQLSAELTYRKFSEDDEANLDFDDGDNQEELIPETVPVGGGILRVTVRSGENLEGKSYSNPYVKVVFRRIEKKTKVVKKTTEPEFDELPFEFLVEQPPIEEKVHVQAWSKNLSRVTGVINSREQLGHISIPLRDVVANGRINDIFQLDDSKNGKLKIELQWIEKKAPPPVPSANGAVAPEEKNKDA